MMKNAARGSGVSAAYYGENEMKRKLRALNTFYWPTHTHTVPVDLTTNLKKKQKNGKPRHSYKNGCNEFL